MTSPEQVYREELLKEVGQNLTIERLLWIEQRVKRKIEETVSTPPPEHDER
jgi:hypothetical protein